MDSPLQSYADWDAAQNSGGEFHGASERKEQPDTVRECSWLIKKHIKKQNKDSRPAAIPYSKAAIEKLSSNKVLLLQFLIRFL